MSTFLELRTRVTDLIEDDDVASLVGTFINQGVSEIAGGVISLLDGANDPIPNIIIPPLPELFTIGTVETSLTDPFVSMPDDFQRDLNFVSSARGSEIDIAHSFISFIETYPLLNKVGTITEVFEHGKKLYYQGIPTTEETLTLYYYRKPVAMEEYEDVPDGIPEHLQMSLLSSFACWKSYEFLEDGIEGEIPNTIKYKNSFIEAVRALEITLPYDTRGLMLR